MDFVVGKIFEKSYPPEAAIWCNNNNAYLKEIEPKNDVRRFEIFRLDSPSKEYKLRHLKEVYKEITANDSDWYIISEGYKINGNKDSLDSINILINNFDKLKATSTKLAFKLYDNSDVLVTLDQLKSFKVDLELSFIDLKKQYWEFKNSDLDEFEFKHFGE